MAHQCRRGRWPAFSLPALVIFVIGDRFRVSLRPRRVAAGVLFTRYVFVYTVDREIFSVRIRLIFSYFTCIGLSPPSVISFVEVCRVIYEVINLLSPPV